jgi:cytochrome c oxidase subunit 2
MPRARFRGTAKVPAIFLCAFVAGCSGTQTPLDPAGDQALRIVWLFWFFVGTCAVVWSAVVIVMLIAIARRRSAAEPQAANERGMNAAVGISTGITVFILIVFTVSSYFTTRGFGATPQNAVQITLTGKQWWWQIEYQGSKPSETFSTANELHIPAGQAVSITLKSNDVIHSFWVPNLAGKQDLIPGRTNMITFTAVKPGIYRGQCAEFCGLQHAHMALLVIAQSPQEFAAWQAHELSDAEMPNDPERTRGLDVFLSSGCVACHSLRGTPASGLEGPDLTHVAARRTIAAGTLPNTRGTLQGWIADPQGIKPGARMPRLELSAADLNAVSAYLAGLK